MDVHVPPHSLFGVGSLYPTGIEPEVSGRARHAGATPHRCRAARSC